MEIELFQHIVWESLFSLCSVKYFRDISVPTVVPYRDRELTLRVVNIPDADGALELTQVPIGRSIYLLVKYDPGTPWNCKWFEYITYTVL